MNIIERLCGPPWRHRREQLFKAGEVPVQSEMREQIGGKLTKVVFMEHVMDDECRTMMGIIPPMRGPQYPLWVSPTDVLEGDMKLKPPAAISQLRASGHSAIVEFGTDIVRKFQNELRGEVLNAIYEVQKHMKWACADDIRKIEDATRISERKLCEQSKDTLVKKVAVDLESLQDMKKKNVADNLAILIQKERKEVQELMDDKMKYAFRLKDTEDRKKCRAAIDAALDQQAAEYQRLMDEMRLKIMQSMSNALEELRAEKECFQRQLESDILTDVAETVVTERLRAKDAMAKRDSLKPERAGWSGQCPALALEERARELQETVNDSKRLLRHVIQEFHRFAAYVQKERPSQFPAMLTMDGMVTFEKRLERPLDKCKEGKKVKDEFRSMSEDESEETLNKETGTEQYPSVFGSPSKAQRHKSKRKSETSRASKMERFGSKSQRRDSAAERPSKAEGPSTSSMLSESSQDNPWNEVTAESPDSMLRKSITTLDDPLRTPTSNDTPKRRELRCFSLTSVERLVLNALQEVETAAQLYGGLIPEEPPYQDPCMRRALDVVSKVVPGVDEAVVAAMKPDGAAARLGDLLCSSRGPENMHYPSSESDMEGDEGRRSDVFPRDKKPKKNILLPGTGSPDGGIETLFDSDFEQEAEKLLADVDAAKLRGPPADIRREMSEPVPDIIKEPDPFCVCTDKSRILIVPDEIPVKKEPLPLKRKIFEEIKNTVTCHMNDPAPEDYPTASLRYSDDYGVFMNSDPRFFRKIVDPEPDLYEIRGADPQKLPQKRLAHHPVGKTVELVKYVRPVGAYPFEKGSEIVDSSMGHPHPYDKNWVKSGRYSDVRKEPEKGEAVTREKEMPLVEQVAYNTTKYYREISGSLREPDYISIGGPGFPDELGRRYNPCTCTDDDRYHSPGKDGKSRASTWASISMRPLGMERDSLGSDGSGMRPSFDPAVPGHYNDYRFQSIPRGRSIRYGEQVEERLPDAREVQRLHTYDYRGQPGFPDEVGPGVPPYPPSNKQDSRRSSLDQGASVEEEKPFTVKPIYKKDVKRPSTDISGLGHKYGDRGIVEEKVPPIFVEMKKSSFTSEEPGEEDDGTLRPLYPEDLIAPMYPYDRGDPCNVECDALCAPHDLVEFDLPGGRDGTERPDFYDRGPLHRGMDAWLAPEDYPFGEGQFQQGQLPHKEEYGEDEEEGEGEEVECIACAEEMMKVRYPDVPCIPGYTGKEGFPAEALTPCEPPDVCPAHREEMREEPLGKYPEMKPYTPSLASESSTDVVNVPEYDLSDQEEGIHEPVRSSQDPQWKGEHWAQPFIVAPTLGTCPAAEWPTRVCPTAYLLPIGVFPKGHAKGEANLTFPHKLSHKISSHNKRSTPSTKDSTLKKPAKSSKAKRSVEEPEKKEDSDSDDSPRASGFFQRMRPSGYVPSGAGGDSDSPPGSFDPFLARMRASGIRTEDMGSITEVSGGSMRRMEPAYGTDPYVTSSAVPYEPAGTGYPVAPVEPTRRRSTGPGNYAVPGQPGIPPSGFPRDSKSRRTHAAKAGRPSVYRPGTIPCKGASTQPNVCVAGESRKYSIYPGLKRAATAVAAVAAGLPSLALGPHPGVAATLSPKDSLRCSRADLCAIDRLMARGAIASPAEYWRLMQRGAIKPSGSKERVGPRVSVATLSEQELLGILDPCGHRLPSKKETPLASIPETPPPTTDTEANACPAMKRVERVREKERKTGEQLATALMERLEKERQLRKPKGKKGEGSDSSPKGDGRGKPRLPKAPTDGMSTVEGEANARVLDVLRKLAVHPSLSKMFVGAGV